jgi:hypothetical protein
MFAAALWKKYAACISVSIEALGFAQTTTFTRLKSQ